MSEFRKVSSFHNPFEIKPASEPITSENYKQVTMAQTIRNRTRIEILEKKLLDDLKSSYPGLSVDQRHILKKSLDDDKSLRQKLRAKSLMKETPVDDTYSRQIAQSSIFFIPDEEVIAFPVSIYPLVSDLHPIGKGTEESEDSLEKSSKDIFDDKQSNSIYRKKYSVMADFKKFDSPGIDNGRESKDLQKQALAQMKITTIQLQEWSAENLDKPVELIPDLDPEHPDPERPTTVPGNEIVDIGGLDILLNACKPTLLDSKPPIRLNVVQESSPPENLVTNISKNLNANIKKNAQSKKEQTLPELKSSFTYKPKVVKERLIYGHWYVKPKYWSENMMKLKNGESKEKIKVEEGLHGLVQRKLEEIRRNREREDAEILSGMDDEKQKAGPKSKQLKPQKI